MSAARAVASTPAATRAITMIRPVGVPRWGGLFCAIPDDVGLGLPLGSIGGTSAVSAAYGLTMPYPYSGSRPLGPLSVAVAVNRWITSVAFIVGYLARINATTPAVIAAEAPVPLLLPYLLPASINSMSAPGAEAKTCGPVTEKSGRFP